MARTVGANRQQSKEVQHRPKITTPEWPHAAVACMADIQPSALGTGCHPGSETSVGLPGQHKLYVRLSHMLPEPHHDELHTFRRETEPRRHCRNEGWIRAVADSHCRHDMMMMVLCENENFLTSHLLCFFTKVKLCPLVILLSFISIMDRSKRKPRTQR